MASISNVIYSELKRSFKEIKSDMIKAETAALNRAAKTALSRTIRFIREKYNIKLKDISPYITFSKATKNRLSVQIRVSHKGMPLVYFGARVNKARGKRRGGVYAAEKKVNKKLYPSAFITRANRPGQLNAVFKRKGKERLPIQELFGPSAMQLFSSKKAQQELERVFFERLKIETDYAMNALRTGSFRESSH
jgi:hypothetical protein